MKGSQSLVAAFGLLVAAAHAWSNDSYVATTMTITTDVYTTFCPEATTFSYGTQTFTATASETITITDCPCTVVQTGYPTYGAPKPVTSSAAPPTYPTYAPSPPVSPNGTHGVPPVHPSYPVAPPPSALTTKTVVVSSYTTYCPAATTFTEGSITYSVGQPTTLTIQYATPYTTVEIGTYPASTPTLESGSNPGGPIKNSTATVHYSTYPVVSTKTISQLTTYCPEPTTVTLSSQVITLSSGTNTVPIMTYVTLAPPTTVVGTISATKTPVAPSGTSSVPILATGAASHLNAGALAVGAAGLAALLL